MKNLAFSYDELGTAGGKAAKRLAGLFGRAGAHVVATTADPRVRRTSGVTYRDVSLTFADGQQLTVSVKPTGDVFQVKVNGKPVPIRNQDDHMAAVGEIAKYMETGRAKFQVKLAHTRAALPKGLATAAPRMEVALAGKEAQIDEAIATATARIGELKAEIGGPVMDDVTLDGVRKINQKDYAFYVVAKGKIESGWEYEDDAKDQKKENMADSLKAGAKIVKKGGLKALGIDPDDNAHWLSTSNMDAVNLDEANQIAERCIAGAVFDSVDDLELAKSTLSIALETVETNMPINLAAGKVEQAELERQCAEQYRKALAILDNSGAFEPPVSQTAAEDGEVKEAAKEAVPGAEEASAPAVATDEKKGDEAILDDATSWLGYAVVNKEFVDQLAPADLPSNSKISDAVYIRLQDDDGSPLLISGIVTNVAFNADKVFYSVAVPISPEPKEGLTLYAVIPDIPSELVSAIGEQTLDAVADYDAKLAALKQRRTGTDVTAFIDGPAPVDSNEGAHVAVTEAGVVEIFGEHGEGQKADDTAAVVALVPEPGAVPDPAAYVDLPKPADGDEGLLVAVSSDGTASQIVDKEPPVSALDDAKWGADVDTNWSPPEGFFEKSAEDIASRLKSASDSLQQAMARLNFYINRAGDNLSADDKSRLDSAKEKLSALYD